MQKHVNLVDLVKSFPTNIYLQNLASIQKRTSPVKFAHLAEKSGKGSISNLSTKVKTVAARRKSNAWGDLNAEMYGEGCISRGARDGTKLDMRILDTSMGLHAQARRAEYYAHAQEAMREDLRAQRRARLAGAF